MHAATGVAVAEPHSAQLDAAGLRARWGDVREAARQASSRLMAHLQPARVEDVDGNTVVLSFPRSGAFHRSALDNADLRDAFRDALEVVLGQRMSVRTTEREDDPASPDDARQETRQRDLLNDRLSAAEVAAAREAPLSQLAQTELGAKIVHLERDR